MSAAERIRANFLQQYGVNLPRNTDEVPAFVTSIRALVDPENTSAPSQPPRSGAAADSTTNNTPTQDVNRAGAAGGTNTGGAASSSSAAAAGGATAVAAPTGEAPTVVDEGTPITPLPISPAASSANAVLASVEDITANLHSVLGNVSPTLTNTEFMQQQIEAYQRLEALNAARNPSTTSIAASGNTASSSSVAVAPAPAAETTASASSSAALSAAAPAVDLQGDLCVVCQERPRDASFIHGNTAHIACCYECAVRTSAGGGRCPICRRRIDLVESPQGLKMGDGAGSTIEGVYIYASARYEDARGDYTNVPTKMVVLETGTAVSRRNVVRGIHCSPFPKSIGCISGQMYDIIIDLRPLSATFGKVETRTLKNDTTMLFIPAGVGHGYLATEDNTLTLYLKGGVFDPSKEYNMNIYDRTLGIQWPVPKSEHVISAKDKALPNMADLLTLYPELQPKPKKCWYAPNMFEAYGEEEMFAVAQTLRDGWLAPGPKTTEFEKQVSAHFGKKYGIFVNSGSSANMIGLAVHELPKGSEIITPSCTFSTVLAPIEQLGLTPVFVDVTLETYVPKEEDILAAITPNTKMLMIPNLIGSKPNWKFLKEKLAEMGRSDIVMFEDSCDCMTHTKESDVSAISFYASHIITAGGMGGMFMCNDQALIKRAYMYRDWGRVGNNDEDMAERFKASVDNIEYDGKFLYSVKGFNMKSCEMCAAFGLEQMKKLKKFTDIRRENIHRFISQLGGTRYLLPRADYNDMDWLALPLQHQNRAGVIRFLEKNDVQIRVTFAGNVTRHPAYRHYFKEYANSDTIMRNGFLLGAHHGLTFREIDRIVALLIEFDETDKKA